MNKTKITVVLLLVCFLMFFATACGNSSSNSEKSDVDKELNKPVTSVEASTVEQVITTPKPMEENDVEYLLGQWVSTEDKNDSIKLTKNDKKLTFEDSDGKYPIVFKDGKLLVMVAKDDTAEVYIGSKYGNLVVSYQGSKTEYKKK